MWRVEQIFIHEPNKWKKPATEKIKTNKQQGIEIPILVGLVAKSLAITANTTFFSIPHFQKLEKTKAKTLASTIQLCYFVFSRLYFVCVCLHRVNKSIYVEWEGMTTALRHHFWIRQISIYLSHNLFSCISLLSFVTFAVPTHTHSVLRLRIK